MTDKDLEQLKHRLRLREIFLDKFVLAILLASLAFYANQRLARYENTLDGELEKLKSVYNFQRILDQREIDAHESAWNAVAKFRAFVTSELDTQFSSDLEEKISASNSELNMVLQMQSLYLTQKTQDAISSFLKTDVERLVDEWSGPDGRGVLSLETMRWFEQRVLALGATIASEIQAKRNSQEVREDA